MANSKIVIEFTADLVIGSQLGIEIGYDSTPPPVMPSFPNDYFFKWVSVRSTYQQVSVGVPTAIAGERAAINFAQAFNLDCPGFIVTRVLNVVTIEYVTTFNYGMTISAVFTSPISGFDFINGVIIPFPNTPSINVNIFDASLDMFTLDSSVFSTAIIPCTHVKYTANTNVLSTKILSPTVVNPNTLNPFNFEVLRGSTFNLILENANGTQINQTINAPDLLTEANFEITVSNSPNGATVFIEDRNNSTYGLVLEYSLDNVNWQTSNIFSGVIAGNYMFHVRDQFGCSFAKDFLVNSTGIYMPNFYISKSNSIRFANRITWGDSANYKTDENTLSCEVDVDLVYGEIQQFQSADIITTQFRSNFATNIATVIKENQTTVNIPVVKKTNNIGIQDKRDARLYDLGNGKNGVYFLSGNNYDYTTGIITSTYTLNGLLPEFCKIGNYFQISGTWYLIEDVVFDEMKNADIIVFSNSYIGAEINVIVGSIFNRENYEVYEFVIDMVSYIGEKFRVKLECIDPNFTTITHLSELIWCEVKHEKVLEIRYSNSTNTDIMYSTGIQHKIRIPYIKISGKTDENSEIHKTDTDVILLNSDLYEADEILFEPVTKEIWRKLLIALSHEEVTINEVSYVKNGGFNTEGPLGSTNLYVLTVIMLKSGNIYNSQTSGATGFDGTAVAVPGLISTQSGFVSY